MWILEAFFTALLNFLANVRDQLGLEYVKRKKNQDQSRGAKENLVDAKTDEEIKKGMHNITDNFRK